MAIEFTFYGAADMETDELRSVVAAAMSGSLAADGTVDSEGLGAFAFRVPPDEEAHTPRLFGFVHRITVLFRFANLKRHLEEHNTALMVSVVLAINDRTRAGGVLLFNGEQAVILCRDGEAVFAADWEDWYNYPEVVALRSGRPITPLTQPLL